MLEPEVITPSPAAQTTDPLFRRTIIIACMTGLVYALLAHGAGPGVGWAVLLLVMVGSLTWHLRGTLDRQTRILLAAGAGLAVLIAIRELTALVALNVVAFMALISIAMGLQRRPGLHRWGVTALVGEIVDNLLALVGDALGYLRAGKPEVGASARQIRQRLGPIVVGLVASLLVIGVFGTLLISADAVFQSLSDGLLAKLNDLPSLLVRLVASAAVMWITIGVIARFRRPPPVVSARIEDPHVQLPVVLLPLVSLNVLFTVFVVIQFAYLFGGTDTLERTGLTHAQYARRGFFELVAVAALVVVVILAAEWMTRTMDIRRPIMVASRLLVVLTLVVGIAAVRRMLLYVDEFGLTQLRVYTTTFLVWVGIVLIWLGVTVLRRRREGFVIGTIVSAFVLTVVLNLINPAAFIADVNLDRSTAGKSVDINYLIELGPGAVPAVRARLDHVEDRADQALLLDWLATTETGRDWRSMTLDAVLAGQGSE